MTPPVPSSREALAAVIARLRRADGPSHARSLARTLAAHVGTMDRALRADLAAALARWQLDSSLASAPLSLGIGETWLLLHAGGTTGHVARLVAREERGSPVASGVPFIRSSELGTVLHGLGAAAARACRQLPAHLLDDTAFEIAGAARSADVHGRSLELSAAVALLSRALTRAPCATTAGSACVRADGSLDSVAHLPEKVAALRSAFPDVRTVVVAETQELPADTSGFDVRRVRTLDEALDHFGLELRSLPPSLVEDHLARARSFEVANTLAHSPEKWRRLSLEAWESSVALATHEPAESTHCLAWAGLFSVHAGDPAALALMQQDDPAIFTAHPAIGVWMAIGRATGAIDGDDLVGAEGLARQAVDGCEALPPHERSSLRGQALGTLGRVLMHAGRYAEAEPHLRAGAEHHREHVPNEHARSLSYLAACLRHAGRQDEALAAVEEALEVNARHVSIRRSAQTTEHYLHLERGRVLIELEAYDEAERELFSVMPRAALASYPRLGAERSLVRLHLRACRDARALEAWQRCLDAGRQLRGLQSDVLMRVACVGLLEAVKHGVDLRGADKRAALELGEAAFGRRLTPDEVDELIAAWIY